MSAVSPSASSLVDWLSVVLAISRNLLPAVVAHGAALLSAVNGIGVHRHRAVGVVRLRRS